MNLRYGLQARFLAVMALALTVVVALMVLLWSRQERIQLEVEAVSRDAMNRVAGTSLRRQGEGLVIPLSESLANPVYSFDLDAIGVHQDRALRDHHIALDLGKTILLIELAAAVGDDVHLLQPVSLFGMRRGEREGAGQGGCGHRPATEAR